MKLAWKKLKEEEIKIGFRSILKRTFKLPNNKIDNFYVNKGCPAVCILPFTKNNKIILTKQFRPGLEKIIAELPGGGMNTNETPEQAAKRELLEETGFQGNIKFVTESFDCAYSTMIRYNFIATDCEKIKEPKLDETEFIKTITMSLDEFKNYLRSGKLTDVETGYLGLDFLGLL